MLDGGSSSPSTGGATRLVTGTDALAETGRAVPTAGPPACWLGDGSTGVRGWGTDGDSPWPSRVKARGGATACTGAPALAAKPLESWPCAGNESGSARRVGKPPDS
jgi:hypothetical protein